MFKKFLLLILLFNMQIYSSDWPKNTYLNLVLFENNLHQAGFKYLDLVSTNLLEKIEWQKGLLISDLKLEQAWIDFINPPDLSKSNPILFARPITSKPLERINLFGAGNSYERLLNAENYKLILAQLDQNNDWHNLVIVEYLLKSISNTLQELIPSLVKHYHDLINDNLTTKQTRLRAFLSVL